MKPPTRPRTTTDASRRVAPSSRQPARAAGKRVGARESPTPTRNEIAYETIKEAVVSLRLVPGEVLNAAQLAQAFDLGRTPVARALHRLMAEGMVQILPRKGVAVVPLSLDEAMSLIEVRRVNEALCLTLAAERITAAELAHLEHLLDAFEAAAAERSIAKLLRADAEFHDAIAAASRNQVLIDLLQRLHLRSARFWAMSLSRQPHVEEVAAEHRAILRCLAAHDAAGARAAVEAHIDSFRDNLTGSAARPATPAATVAPPAARTARRA